MQELKTATLLDLTKTIAKDLLTRYVYPWEALPNIGAFLRELAETLPESIYDKTGDHIYIAKSARIARTADITGPCIIGEQTEIRPGAYIRGNAVIGSHAVIGNSTELKNVILFDEAKVPHYNYVGDSILGFSSHMGAGAITSNVKNDKTLIHIRTQKGSVETGMKKLGAVLGDFVEVGCNSVLNPGTIVGKHTNIYPLSFVRGFIPSDSIVKTGNVTVPKK